VAPKKSTALNIVFYAILGCFILLSMMLTLANGTVGVLLFDRKVDIGMDKEMLVERLGPPSHIYAKGEPTDQDFFRQRGVKPASQEILTYTIHGFVLGYTAFVYIDESGKVAEIALWNSDSMSADYNYERVVRGSRIIAGLWAGFGALLLLVFLLRRAYRTPPEKRSKADATEALSQPTYPEADFEFDREAASFVLTRTSGAIERLLTRWAIVMFVLVVPGAIFLVLHKFFDYIWPLYVALALVGCVGFTAPAILGTLFVLARLQLPRARCSGCGKKMKKKWSMAEGRKRLFLICPGCKRYANTCLSSLSLSSRQSERQTDEQDNPAD
jgi:hypothetical protein